MPLTQLAPPYPIFTDKNGDPLDAGYLYFGEPNLNPETNPITVYYDRGLTQPAFQPLRTSNGYIMRNGSPALLYADGQFSITVRNKSNELVIYSPVGFGVTPGVPFAVFENAAKDVDALLADTEFTYSADIPNTVQVTAGDILRTLAEGFAYEVAASGATNQHVTTAGGVKLYVLPGERGFNVKAFGAKGDGVSDDTAAIAKAISASYAAGQTVDQFTAAERPIYIPGSSETYRINQNNALFNAVSGGTFNFVGDGYVASLRAGASVLEFNPPTDSPSNVMIVDLDWGNSSFTDIGFKSTNGSKFMRAEAGLGGLVRNLSWTRCSWDGFTDIFDVDGAIQTSEWTFIDCRFANFDGIAFDLNNVQSVNWNFYACQATVFSGTLFYWRQGVPVQWYGGNIIPTADTAIVLAVDPAANSATFSTSQPHNFCMWGGHMEIRGAAKLINKQGPNCNFAAVFHQTQMGGLNIGAGSNAIVWDGRGKLAFYGCGNLRNYRMTYTTNSSTITQELQVIARDCRELDRDFITGSTFTDSSNRSIRRPKFYIQNCNPALDGEYVVSGNAIGGLVPQWRAMVPLSVVDGDFFTGTYNGVTPLTADINIPPAMILGVRFYPLPVTGFGSTNTATITLKDTAGTTLASFTWDADTPASVALETNVVYKVSNTDPRIVAEFTSTVTGVAFRWRGNLTLLY